jgi:hypothetical protein
MRLLIFVFCITCLFCTCKKDPTTGAQPPVSTDTTLVRWYHFRIHDINEIFLPGPEAQGSFAALKNGKNWAGSSGFGFWDSTGQLLDIGATTFDSLGNIREKFVFWKVPKRIGMYKFDVRQFVDDGFISVTYSRRFDDGDVIGDQMIFDPVYSKTDFFEITKLDTVNEIIGGRFDVHLTDSTFTHFIPVYLHFANGTFETKY